MVEQNLLIDPALIATTTPAQAQSFELFPNYQTGNSLTPQASDHSYQAGDQTSYEAYQPFSGPDSAQPLSQDAQIHGTQSPYRGYQIPFNGSVGNLSPTENLSFDQSLQTMAESALDQARQPSLPPPNTPSPIVAQGSWQSQQPPSLTVRTEITTASSATAPSTGNPTASMVSPPNSSLQDSDPQLSPNIDPGLEVTNSIETGADHSGTGDNHDHSLHTPRSTSVSHSQKSRTKSPKIMKVTSNETDPDTESMRLIKELAESEFGLRRRSTKT